MVRYSGFVTPDERMRRLEREAKRETERQQELDLFQQRRTQETQAQIEREKARRAQIDQVGSLNTQIETERARGLELDKFTPTPTPSFDPVEAERQAFHLVDNGVGVLVMLRDFTSQRRVTKENWTAAMSDSVLHYDKIHYTLPYYRLVKEPDVVQVEVAEVFGMEIVHLFSGFPDFIDPSTIPTFQNKGFEVCHNLRRIGAPCEEGVSGTRHRTTHREMEESYNKQNGVGPPPEAVGALEDLLATSETGKDLEVSELGIG